MAPVAVRKPSRDSNFVPDARLDPSQVVDERNGQALPPPGPVGVIQAPKPPKPQNQPIPRGPDQGGIGGGTVSHKPTGNTPAHHVPKMPRKGVPNPHNIHK